MHPRALVAPLLAILLLPIATLAAGDAPTDSEWAPVAKAIQSGAADASDQAEAVTKQYPNWPDGFRALGLLKLRAGDAKAAWSAALKALRINGKDAEAAVIGVQALSALVVAHEHNSQGQERTWADVFQVAGKFEADADDPGGKVAAQAAVAALQAGDGAALGTWLGKAKTRAGATPNPVLDFVEAKQAMGKRDLVGARTALEHAIATRPDYHDALYELGRVRFILALGTPDQAEALLAKADEAFAAAVRLDARDAAARFGLGRTRLELGKRQVIAGKTDAGEAVLRTAIGPLDEALQLEPGNVSGKLWKGDILLRLKRWDEAASMLKQALDGGASDRALPFNLAMALTNSGKPAEAAQVLQTLKAEYVDERLTMAMNAFHQRSWATSSALLLDALKELDPEDAKQGPQRLAAIRYFAHCQRELAAVEASPVEREKYLVSAVTAYQDAGKAGDFPSRHWYVATNAPRSPQEAFATGKQLLDWDGFFTPAAWKLLIANYGWKVSHGEGVSGLFKYGLAHLMLWALLAMIAAMLFLKDLVLPAASPAKATARPGTASTRRPGAAKPGTAKPGAPKPIAKPGSALTRKPGAGRPPSAGAKTPFGGG